MFATMKKDLGQKRISLTVQLSKNDDENRANLKSIIELAYNYDLNVIYYKVRPQNLMVFSLRGEKENLNFFFEKFKGLL